MRYYYSAVAIREAEAPLLASLPDGVLMRRAANGLADAIARELNAEADAMEKKLEQQRKAKLAG